MPQPFSRIIPDAYIILDEDYWLDKPEVTGLVAVIFATWSKIETELGSMLVRILGADSAPALAMHEALLTQNLKRAALNAAASAALAPEDYDCFVAVMSVLDSAQRPRNQLAHWVWGHCKQKPEMLALADPKMVQETRQRTLKFFLSEPDNLKIKWDSVYDLMQYDNNQILSYSADDLKRALADIKSASHILSLFEHLLDPEFKGSPSRVMVDFPAEEAREELLRQLNEQRLFREAFARVQNAKGRKSTPPKKP